jgi:hypothetical protein
MIYYLGGIIMTNKSIILFLSFLLLCGTNVFAQIRVSYKCIEKNPTVQQIKFNFKILNDLGVPAQLSEIKIRYYYSRESYSREECHVEYASIGSSNVVGQFFPGYLEISFKQDAGVIPSGGDCGEIQIRLNMVDWMVYDQGNDFSYDPSKLEYSDSSKIALFLQGANIWGMEAIREQQSSNVNPSPGP